MAVPSGPFRDVYSLLKSIRNFLLGRKPHYLHNRFHPFISPRSIPTPDIPRGPEYKYANQSYHRRSALHSVHPPVVAPVALGVPKKKGGLKETITCKKPSGHIHFCKIPTPGLPYWWDGHGYWECTPDYCPPEPKPKPEIPPDVPSHIRRIERCDKCP